MQLFLTDREKKQEQDPNEKIARHDFATPIDRDYDQPETGDFQCQNKQTIDLGPYSQKVLAKF